MGLRVSNEGIQEGFRRKLATSVERVESGGAKVNRDADGKIIPSPDVLQPDLVRDLNLSTPDTSSGDI